MAARIYRRCDFPRAHVVPAGFEDRADDYVELVCGDAGRLRPLARWIGVFCEVGAFDREQSRRVLEAGREAGSLGLRVHGNQLGPGPGVKLAVEMGSGFGRPLHHLEDADLDALASGSRPWRPSATTDFSTRQPYPDARRAIDAGSRSRSRRTQPGSSNTTAMGFCLALAVRDMGMTIDRGDPRGDRGGAAALAVPTSGAWPRGPPTPSCSKPLRQISSTGRGALVGSTFIGGQQ